MSLTDLKNHIKSGEFAPLYLFAGEESYLMRHYLSLVKGKLLNGFEDNSYRPKESLSRAEAAKIICMITENI